MGQDDRLFTKCAWRLIPLMMVLYVVFFLDRVNVGFAALTMNGDLGFSPSVYGFGAGLLFVGLSLFSVPSGVLLERFGVRRWLLATLAVWGVLSAATAFVRTPAMFYVLRFLLGIAESGFVPGLVFYLTYWFPHSHRTQFTAWFLVAQPVAFILGAPLSGLILQLDAPLGLHGWQWLFLIEGLPSCALALVAYFLFPERPARARWLTAPEKQKLAQLLASDDPVEHSDLWPALLDPRIIALGAVNFGVFFGLSGITLWLPQITRAMGFSNLATSFLVALPFIAASFAMILWGRAGMRRTNRFSQVALPALVAALGFAGAALTGSDVVSLMSLSLAVIGIYASLSPLINLPASFLGGAAAASGTALVYAIGGVGAFLGPAMIGVLKEETGTYTAAMAALSGALVAAALIVLVLGRMMARPAPRAARAS